jgi:DNA-binding winged helix-turn-helix (wHTH) protein
LERRRLEAALQALGGSPGGLGRRLPSPCDMSTELLRIGDGLARLGLGGHCRFEIIDRHGRRDADESDCQRMLAERCLVIDLSRGLISRQSGEAIAGRPLMAALLLALLGTAADGVSAERLFYDVWGGREWNPLRHRNTIHVAIARLRQLLRELLPGREVVETAQSGWRLSREIDICAIRAKSPE